MDTERYALAKQRVINRLQQLELQIDPELKAAASIPTSESKQLDLKAEAQKVPVQLPGLGPPSLAGSSAERKSDGPDDTDKDAIAAQQKRITEFDEDLLAEIQVPVPLRPLQEREQLELQQRFYGRTRVHTGVKQQKVADDNQGYDLTRADEGFYEPPPPDVSDINKSKLEARLVREDLKKAVFFEDGKVKFEPNPIVDRPLRPDSGYGDFAAPDAELATRIDAPHTFTGRDHYFDFKVSILQLDFQDHPLFTKEDFLCKQIELDYEEYKRRETVNLVKFYAERIRVYRKQFAELSRKMDDLERKLGKDFQDAKLGSANELPPLDGQPQSPPPQQQSPETTAGAQLDVSIDKQHMYVLTAGAEYLSIARKLMTTLERLREAREHRDREESEMILLFRQMYQKWKAVRGYRADKTAQLKREGLLSNFQPKDQKEETKGDSKAVDEKDGKQQPPLHNRDREEPGFVGYPIQLQVRKIDMSDAAADEKDDWDRAQKDELAERKKLYDVHRVLSKHFPSEYSLPGVQGAGPSNHEDPSHAFSEMHVIEKIQNRMSRSRRQPGAPQFLPKLKTGVAITPFELCDKKEKQRRREVEEAKLYIVLMVNHQVVDHEPEEAKIQFPLWRAAFHLDMAIKLLSVPHSILIEVRSKRPFRSDLKIGEVIVPVPEYGSAQKIQDCLFSGLPIEDVAIPDYPGRHLTGKLSLSVHWETDAERPEDVDEHGVPSHFEHTIDVGDRSLAERRKKMQKMHASRLAADHDPNDPRNAAIIEILRREKLRQERGRIFRPREFEQELHLVTLKYYMRAPRAKVLRTRNESTIITEAVPLDEDEMGSHLYDLLVLDDAPGKKKDDATLESEEIESKNYWRQKRKMLLVKPDIYDVEDVVREEARPVFGTLFDFASHLNKLFAPRRDLRIKRMPIRSVANPKACNVIVQIIEAHNLPVRRTYAIDESLQPPPVDRENVRVFIEVSFQDHAAKQTSVQVGTNARWNQLISLPFRPPGDNFSPAYLQQVQDHVHFYIFDELKSKEALDAKRNKTKLEQVDHRYLGSFSVPWTTIYNNGRVDGPFRVTVPLLHLGYDKPEPKRETTVWIYATLDPRLTAPSERVTHFEHQANFFAHAVAWAKGVKEGKKQCKNRKITALAADINGKPQLLCRYIWPQQPPRGYESPKLFTRFVSLIPFIDDVQASGGVSDIWCTDREFLDLRSGDWEEHAILLANYFKWDESVNRTTHWRTFVALGLGVPEGNTAYVIRILRQDYEIKQVLAINAVTGETYDIHADMETLPLKSIHVLFDQDNVWANIQEVDEPFKIRFNVNDPSLWSAFSQEGITALRNTEEYKLLGVDLGTIQQPPNYFMKPANYYTQRSAKIERILIQWIEKWRLDNLRMQTNWDFGVAGVLRDMLQHFEFIEQKMSEGVESQRPLAKLRSAFDTIYGFPLNFAEAGEEKFVDDKSEDNPVVQRVKKTRVHDTEDAQAVFAIAAYIHPYPNKVGSLWVYVASLTSRV